jgi:hypothetical protein
MFGKLYGRMKDQENLRSILDGLTEDFRKVEPLVSAEDKQLLADHQALVRELEQELKSSGSESVGHAVPPLEPGIKEENDNMPKLSKMQIDLMVSSFAADFARIATYQITNSVGGAKMRWLGVDEGHHELSHHEDSKTESQEKLIKINRWYCEQLAYLAQRLAETPEPGGGGSLLDNTLLVWTNELGKGNSHTLNNIRSCWWAAGSISRWAARSSSAKCRTTVCCCRWPTASVTASTASAIPTSAATGR